MMKVLSLIWVNDPVLSFRDGKFILSHKKHEQVLSLKIENGALRIGCTLVTIEAARELSKILA